jgi:hypothetical protein
MLIAPMQLPLTRKSDKRWLKNFRVEIVFFLRETCLCCLLAGLAKCGQYKPDANRSKTLPYLSDDIFPQIRVIKIYDKTSYFRSKT